MSGTAYLGIGLGVTRAAGRLIAPAMAALRTAGFRAINRSSGVDGAGQYKAELDGLLEKSAYADDFKSTIETQMKSSSAVIIILTLPDNDQGLGKSRMSEAMQHRIMDVLEWEYEVACSIRDEISKKLDINEGLDFSQANIREQVEKDILLFAPSPSSSDFALRGYSNSVLVRFERFFSGAEETKRQVNHFDTPESLFEKICANIFEKFPNVAQATVMVSATGKDLKREHETLQATINLLGHRSETSKSRLQAVDFLDRLHTQEAERASRSLLSQSSMYMGIVKNRVTSATSRGLSLTEFEYDLAYETGRQCGFFVANQEVNVTPEFIEQFGPEEQQRLDRFLERIKERGTPTHPFATADDLRTTAFTMLRWMFRRGSDQQAYPPPIGDDDSNTYIAHPYILMAEDQQSVRLSSWCSRLDHWLNAPSTSPCLLVKALGGMGKSALNWAWMSHVRRSQQRPPRIMWWSFYAHNSGPVQFAKHLLWWLTGKTGIADELIANDNLAGLYDAVLNLLRRDSAKYLFCLDGIERALVAYRDLKTDIAPDEGPTLDLTLREESKKLAEKYRVSEEQAMTYLLKFADRPRNFAAREVFHAVEQQIKLKEDSSHFATFLQRLLAESGNFQKIFVTSRFVPSVFNELACRTVDGQGCPLVDVAELSGLNECEAKELWESIKNDNQRHLHWEESIAEDIGGGTLAEICCESLGGYALAITILGELVAADAEAEGRFSNWKHRQRGFIRAESWRSNSSESIESRLASMNRLQSKLLLLTFNQIKASAGEWDLLSTIIAGASAGTSFSDLYFKCVGPSKRFETPDQLFAALNRLRRWKIVGRSPIGDLYDTHPVVRRGLQEYEPDNDESVRREGTRLLEDWMRKDKAIISEEGQRDVPIDKLLERWDEIIEFLKLGAVATAFELFDRGVDYWLRYRTQGGNVVEQRLQLLVEASNTLQPYIQLQRGLNINLRIFEGLLSCCEVDTQILRGDILQADTVLQKTERFVEELTAEFEKQPTSESVQEQKFFSYGNFIQLKARVYLNRGNIERSKGLRIAAVKSYFNAIKYGRDAEAVLSKSYEISTKRSSVNNSARIAEWGVYCLTSIWMAIKGTDRIGLQLMFPEVGIDVDADFCRYEIAISTGKYEQIPMLVESLLKCCVKADEELNYGIVSAKLCKCEAAIRDWMQMPHDQVLQLLDDVEVTAELQGYGCVADELKLLRLQFGRKCGVIGASDFSRMVLEHADALKNRGCCVLEAKCRLASAQALDGIARREDALEQVIRAFGLAFGDGGSWTENSLLGEISRVCRQIGADVEKLVSEKRNAVQATAEDLETRIATLAPARQQATATQNTNLPKGVTNTKGWSEEQVRKLLEEEKRKYLDWDNTTAAARKWWEDFERENKTRSALILRLVQELKIRQSSIAEFYLAQLASKTDNIQGILYYLDFERLKKAWDNRKGNARKIESEAKVSINDLFGAFEDLIPSDLSGRMGCADNADLPERVMRARVNEIKGKIGYNDEDDAVRIWWDMFESGNQHRMDVILRLVEELLARKATVSEFSLAYHFSNTENLYAVLCFLDYTRLKDFEEKKRKDATKE